MHAGKCTLALLLLNLLNYAHMNCLVLLFLLMGLSASSQRFLIGPVASAGHSYFAGDNVNGKIEFLPYYSAGARLTYSRNEDWGISADLSFAGQGAHLFTQETRYRYRLNYFRPTLQAFFLFGDPDNRIRPKAAIGPSFGFLTGGQTRIKKDNETIMRVASKDNFKDTDFGFTGTLGAAMRLNERVFLHTAFNYYHSIYNIHLIAQKVYNRSISFTTGVSFTLKTSRKKQ